MDFAGELEEIRTFLTRRQLPVAVIGGVALAAYGNPRMTLDLDIVTEASAQDDLIAFMESQGFVTLHRSSGYSNHRHHRRGRVDFMYVRDQTADRLFASVKELAGPGGRPIPVPKPEHLIAMKVQAMRDDPERGLQDLVDIAYLLQVDGVDRDEARGYSCVRVWSSAGMNSREPVDRGPLDLERDVPTTSDDVASLRRLRREVPSWLMLTPSEFDALVPEGALDRRPVTPASARPFTLPA